MITLKFDILFLAQTAWLLSFLTEDVRHFPKIKISTNAIGVSSVVSFKCYQF
jgi:hypothetical protein